MQRTRNIQKNFVAGGVYNPYESNQSQLQPQQEPTNSVSLIQTDVTNSCVVDMNAPSDELVDKNGKIRFKKIFGTRKKASVRAREKKIRQNRRLRKAIVPKNALMALNEVKGLAIGDFIVNNNVGGGFTATVTVNNNQYDGNGSSKIAAKNNACEKALREYIITKMRETSRKRNSVSEPMDIDTEGGGDDDDNVPILNLAAFAIHKLFTEWEKEGYTIPEMHSTGTSTNLNDSVNNTLKEPKGEKQPIESKERKEAKAPPIRNELPTNWEQQHPTTLLCLMRPGIAYIDKGTIGEKPNVLQKLEVTVDGVQYSGCGRSKKIARYNCAVTVCNTLFKTNFVQDNPGA